MSRDEKLHFRLLRPKARNEVVATVRMARGPIEITVDHNHCNCTSSSARRSARRTALINTSHVGTRLVASAHSCQRHYNRHLRTRIQSVHNKTSMDIEAQSHHGELKSPHPHAHYSSRAPWLRAGVLGANDGAQPPYRAAKRTRWML